MDELKVKSELIADILVDKMLSGDVVYVGHNKREVIIALDEGVSDRVESEIFTLVETVPCHKLFERMSGLRNY